MKKQQPHQNIRLFSLIIILIYSFSYGQSTIDPETPPRIGLVLSGGGARGFAHVGVLQILDSLNIPVHFITGTSMGSIVGGLYSIGYSGLDLDSLVKSIDWTIIFSDQPPREKLAYFEKQDVGRFQLSLQTRNYKIQEPSGLIFGQKISLLLTRLITPQYNDVNFDELPIPYRCIAADLITGNEVVLDQGSLPKAIRSSMSVPSIFTPVEWGDSLLVDGGVLNNLPVDVAREMGASHIIAVNVSAPLRSKENLSGAISILYQSLSLAANIKEKENLLKSDIVITPDLQGFSATDFAENKIRIMIERGKAAARKNLDQLLQLQQQSQSAIPSSKTRPRFNKGTLFGIYIQGNKRLSFAFIYQFLGLKPGQTFDIDLIENRIENLYSLGYFQIVDYKVEQQTPSQYRLYITVKENPGAFLRLGFRYQDNYKVILAANLKLKDFPIPGILSDMSYLFSGVQVWEWELGYPRRMFGTRAYPYIYGYYQDIPVDIYLERKKIAQYKKRSYGAAAGIGFVINNWGGIKTDYLYEKLLIDPNIAFSEEFTWPEWKYPVHLFRIYLNFDLLDDPLNPRHGYTSKIGYEKTINLIKQRDNYRRLYIDQSFYGTLFRRNTSSIHLFFGLTQRAELYRYYYLGGPNTFIGYNYDEFSGPNMGIYRFENALHLNNIFSILGIFNGGNIRKNYQEIDLKTNFKTGYGIGLQINTLVGPFRYIISFSEKETVQYFTFGYSLATRNDERK
jgi:NTE family protein